jgi:hypothetical protein
MKTLSSLVVGLFTLTCLTFVSRLSGPTTAHAQGGCDYGEQQVNFACETSWGCSDEYADCAAYYCEGDWDCFAGAIIACGGDVYPNPC